MRRIVFYIPETDDFVPGRIDSIADYDDSTDDATIDADQPDGCVWIEGDADPTTDYILADAITQRPDFGADELYHIDADGEQNTLFTMPEPVNVTYRGVVYSSGEFLMGVDDEDDGYVLGVGDDYLVFSGGDADFIFASDRSGEFRFLIEPVFPYRSMVVTVIADAV